MFQRYHWHYFRQTPDTYGAKGALNATTLNLPDILTYALQDEYLAQARYNRILGTYGYIRTFARIQESELRHISALLPFFQQYQVQVPQDISPQFVTTPPSIKDAYAAGVEAEIENIAMYEKFLSLEIPNELRTVFTRLRDASINHLAAFERGLAR